jgi:hypothetical protein
MKQVNKQHLKNIIKGNNNKNLNLKLAFLADPIIE